MHAYLKTPKSSQTQSRWRGNHEDEDIQSETVEQKRQSMRGKSKGQNIYICLWKDYKLSNPSTRLANSNKKGPGMEMEFLTQLYRGLQGNSVSKWCQQTVGHPQGKPSPRRTMTQGPKQLCFQFLHWRNVLVVNLTQPGVTRKWEAQLKNYLDQIALPISGRSYLD